ncbi:hypothetical protein [Paenibacillus thalictri]|uniref:Uncharacterized protein n=1 Tax=Paenibacillus thalictri TaxID=2527873 RepID=A0A4Q9DJX2_9BACL|nr:hypothetical protein [Paenibacillus thalictri]TBL71378.1 hypothetical protein EYB31_30265 [Paenibacillus thalictri]
MGKKLPYILAVLLLVLVGISIYAVTQQNKNNQERAKPASLQGQSEHWKVTVVMVGDGKQSVVKPTAQYNGLDKLAELIVTVNYKDNTSTSFTAVQPDMYDNQTPYDPDPQAADKSWMDVQNVQVAWKVGDKPYKEFMNVENKAQ